jgi:cobyrinic acid a,c-diamide synthase
VHGYATLDPSVRVAGVILNRVGSDGHETMLRDAIEPLGVPVLGALRRDDALTWRDRHLGLVPVVEHPGEVTAALDRLATLIERSCDLDAVVTLAAAASPVTVPEPARPERVTTDATPVRIAVAGGPAFSFGYPDNVEALRAAGAEIEPFDPCADAALPQGCHGVILGGGFPEVYAEALSANQPLIADLRRQVERGLVVWAECGGLLWLGNRLDDHPMAGVVDVDARMTDRLTLGYRTAVTQAASPLGPVGTAVRGHEFHYSTTEPTGDALELAGRFGSGRAGFATPRLLASYLHVHLGAAPALAEAFVRTAGTPAA